MSKKKAGSKKIGDGGMQEAVVVSLTSSQKITVELPPASACHDSAPSGWTRTSQGSPVFNIPGLAAPKVRILPGRIVDKVTGLRTTREEQKLCECGTAYTFHNKARHLKSKKHTDFMQQKDNFFGSLDTKM